MADPTKTFVFSVDRDLGSLGFLKGIWAQKVILYFREKFLYGGIGGSFKRTKLWNSKTPGRDRWRRAGDEKEISRKIRLRSHPSPLMRPKK